MRKNPSEITGLGVGPNSIGSAQSKFRELPSQRLLVMVRDGILKLEILRYYE